LSSSTPFNISRPSRSARRLLSKKPALKKKNFLSYPDWFCRAPFLFFKEKEIFAFRVFAPAKTAERLLAPRTASAGATAGHQTMNMN
jgi:hypothetical protein